MGGINRYSTIDKLVDTIVSSQEERETIHDVYR